MYYDLGSGNFYRIIPEESYDEIHEYPILYLRDLTKRIYILLNGIVNPIYPCQYLNISSFSELLLGDSNYLTINIYLFSIILRGIRSANEYILDNKITEEENKYDLKIQFIEDLILKVVTHELSHANQKDSWAIASLKNHFEIEMSNDDQTTLFIKTNIDFIENALKHKFPITRMLLGLDNKYYNDNFYNYTGEVPYINTTYINILAGFISGYGPLYENIYRIKSVENNLIMYPNIDFHIIIDNKVTGIISDKQFKNIVVNFNFNSNILKKAQLFIMENTCNDIFCSFRNSSFNMEPGLNRLKINIQIRYYGKAPIIFDGHSNNGKYYCDMKYLMGEDIPKNKDW